jgi:hypothetical protein
VLVNLGAEPDKLVPALSGILAEPQLRPNRKNRPLPYQPEERWAQLAGSALAALQKIGPPAKGAVPTLLKYLEPQDPKSPRRVDYGAIAVNVIRVLGAMGPDAAAALPALRTYRDTIDARSVQVSEIEKAIANMKGKEVGRCSGRLAGRRAKRRRPERMPPWP